MVCPCCNADKCGCPDWCLYQLQVLSPVAWGPRPSLPCGTDADYGGHMFESNTGFYAPCEDPTSCCGPVTSSNGTKNRVYVSITAGYALVRYSSNLSATADVEVELRCETGADGKSAVYADVNYHLIVPAWDGLIPRFPYRAITKTATFKLDSSCKDKAGIVCGLPSTTVSRRRVITTPLEFTVSAASAGLGAWATSQDTPSGDQTRITNCFQHLIDNFSVSLRITARDSCNPAP